MKIRIALLITLSIALGCKPQTNEAKESTEYITEGIWQSEGYGYILQIKGGQVKTYDMTSFNCIPTSEMALNDFLLEQEFEIKTITKNSFTSNVITSEDLKDVTRVLEFKRLNELPELCENSDSSKKNNPLYNFESVWQTYNEHYSFFKERNIDWNAYKAKYKSKLTNKSTDLELYLVLEEMLNALNDGHSMMFVPEALEEEYYAHKEQQRIEKAKNTNTKPVSLDVDEVRYNVVDTYVEETYVYNFGLVIWGRISDDVALVQINGMNNLANYPINIPEDLDFEDAMEYAEEAYETFAEKSKHYTLDEINGAKFIMDSIVSQIKDAKACILDIRFNGGGYDDAGREILRHFISEKINLGTTKARQGNSYTEKQTSFLTPSETTFGGKLIILTSPHTASAAESFTMGTMQIKDAIRIGDNTRGIFSDMLVKQMPNGWEFGMSNELYESPEGINYEAIGIPPHHKINYNKKLFWFMKSIEEDIQTTGKDKAIEKALELIKTTK